jgi:hypothetical protein
MIRKGKPRQINGCLEDKNSKDPISKITRAKRDGGMVEHLSSKHKALSSNPQYLQKRKEMVEETESER